MNRKQLKIWIKENLITKSIRPNSNKFKKNWFIKNNYLKIYNKIFSTTLFLNNHSVSFSERIYYICNDIDSLVICQNPECLNKLSFKSFKIGYKQKFCSPKCAGTCLKIKEKRKKTVFQKYKVNYISQLKIVKNKIKKTCIQKYGVENPYQSEDVKKKIKSTLIKKYGISHPMESEKFKNKQRETTFKKYGVNNPSQRHIPFEILKKLNDKKFIQKCHHTMKMSAVEIGKKLNVSPSAILDYLHLHKINLINRSFSRFEKEIIKFINLNIETNSRSIISPYELDIYIPKHKLAIEFNGLYWHSYNQKESLKQKRKHLLKTEICEEKGIQLLHIFENEWLNPVKQEIWKSIINSKLNKNDRIFARKCIVKEILDTKLIRQFLNNNHLQGFVGSSIKLGLFYENKLVSLMTFSKTRYSKKYQYELIRFCNKKNVNIVGGASKLFKYFIKNYDPKSIISYADRRYSNGNLYNKLNFSFSHNSAPNYFYFKPGQSVLYPRIKFQKHKLEKQLENFDSELSEVENMYNNGYRRIWDCGNMIYIWNK